MENVVNFLKDFRINYLMLSLNEVELLTGVYEQYLFAFENGYNNDTKYFNLYYSLCKTVDDRKRFLNGFDKAMDKDKDKRIINT